MSELTPGALVDGKAVYPAVLAPNAFLVISNREYPATIWPIPPIGWESRRKSTREILATAMSNWSATARSQKMQPWVMCIPDSRRLLQDRLRYVDTNSPMAHWRPTEFEPHLARICADFDIRFIDPLPALRRELDAGRIPYNLFGDGHLSLQGSRVVGDVLAEALDGHVTKRK